MRALVLTDQGIEYRADYPDPEPGPGEVRIRVLFAGICDTDLQLAAGYMGFRGVPGHEFVGVAEGGPLQGKTVVSEINCACGRCAYCARGWPNHCPHRSVLGILNHDGAFADYICVPQVNLHALPDEIPAELGVFVEPLAAAFEIGGQIDIQPGIRTLVLGDGKLGYLIAQVLRLQGAEVTVLGRHPHKLARFQALGFPTQPAGTDSGELFDVVVDCTGSPTGLAEAVQRVRPRGTVVLKTTTAQSLDWNPAPVVINEITIVGSRCGPFRPAIAALASGQIEVRSLIEQVFPLEQGVQAFTAAARTGAGKILLAMGGSHSTSA